MTTPQIEYVDSIYFTGGKREDWLGRIYKPDGGDKWQIEYRFRYHVDAKAFDSDDRKSFYHAEAPDGSDESLASGRSAMREIMAALSQLYGDPNPEIVELQCRNSDSKFFFEIASRPWAHIKQETLP